MALKETPGIHLRKTSHVGEPRWYWYIVSKKGVVVCRSNGVYKRKGYAINSIKSIAQLFETNRHYYDHVNDKIRPDLVMYII